MRLVRVQVPEFRALKNVDIRFEPEFNPQVFPLGSLNGGGKSTLLQLIFVLLHCSAHEERHPFIANMLERITIPEGETNKLLARFELLDGEEKMELEFTLCKDDYLRQLDIDPIFNKEMVSFDIFSSKAIAIASPKTTTSKKTSGLFSEIEIEIKLKKKRIDHLEQLLEKLLEETYITSPVKDNSFNLDKIRHNLSKQNLFNRQYSETENIQLEIQKLRNEIKEAQNSHSEAIDDIDKNYQSLKSNILNKLEDKQQLFITAWTYRGDAKGLVCLFKHSQLGVIENKNLLKQIAAQIFLSAPSSQIYLFLDQTTKGLLFRLPQSSNGTTYESKLNHVKSILPNFLTYDVFAADIIASLIEKSRNQDFKTLVETGTNGECYKKIIAELNGLTQNKKVLPLIDDNAAISGITFQTSEGMDIYPEDLSHGELKRLSIYVWLRSMPQDENIVLIDEIENGLHLDWQYNVVRDLVEWGKNNQYILATHSYELCTAVTPAHVKELEPKDPKLIAQ